MQEMKETQVQSQVGKIPWSRKWQPPPVFLPGEFHGQSLEGYTPLGRQESDMTEHSCALMPNTAVSFFGCTYMFGRTYMFVPGKNK